MTRARARVAAAGLAGGNAVYMALSAFWTLALPRRLDVAAFANWRLFVLYGGFAGVLHLGALDAALVRWSRRCPGAVITGALPVALVAVVGAHAAVALLASVVLQLVQAPGLWGRMLAPLAVYALLWNVVTVLQYAMQGGRRFQALGLFALVHGVLFALAVVSGVVGRGEAAAAWSFNAAATIAALIALVPPAWPALARGRAWRRAPAHVRRWATAGTQAGVPILLVNLLLIVIAQADRVAASLVFDRAAFARYAFAGSLLAVLMTGATVASRFTIPYVTRWVQVGTFEQWYARLAWVTFAGWSLVVVAGAATWELMARIFPRYADALPIAALMLPGLAFSTQLQVVHLPYARAARRLGASTRAAGLALAAGLPLIAAAARHGRAEHLAAAGACAALLWWALDVWLVLPAVPHVRRTALGVLGGIAGLTAIGVMVVW